MENTLFKKKKKNSQPIREKNENPLMPEAPLLKFTETQLKFALQTSTNYKIRSK